MQLHDLEVNTYDGYWDMNKVLNVLSACMTVTYSVMAITKLQACSDADYWVIFIRVSTITDYRQCSLGISPLKLRLNHFNSMPSMITLQYVFNNRPYCSKRNDFVALCTLNPMCIDQYNNTYADS